MSLLQILKEFPFLPLILFTERNMTRLPIMDMAPWWIFVNACVYISVLCVFVAILVDFVKYHRQKAKQQKKSIVETGTMIGFFIVFYLLIRLRIASPYFNPFNTSVNTKIIIFIGLFFVLFGAIVNIFGRLSLGQQWSNQIKIYAQHEIITKGAYKYIRHPLYASLILMFFGASLIYTNPLAFVANAIIFLPFMAYRAKQEEKILSKNFEKYKKYKEQTGMFFPKLWRNQ